MLYIVTSIYARERSLLRDEHISSMSTSRTTGKIEVKDETCDTGKLEQEFPDVKGMSKGIFHQLPAGDNGEVGLALNCVHEINLKPGTKLVKQ